MIEIRIFGVVCGDGVASYGADIITRKARQQNAPAEEGSSKGLD